MSVETSPGFLQAGSYSAEQLRRGIYALLERGASVGSVVGGLIGSKDMEVTAGSGMQVVVAVGEAIVPGSSSTTQSGYYCRVSSATTLAIAAADPTNPRIDRISAVCKDAAYSGSLNEFALAVETGTSTAGATLNNLNGVAAAPTSSLTLGYLLVPANSTKAEAGNISNVAQLVRLGTTSYTEGTLAARPAAGIEGRIYYATDIEHFWIDRGAAWEPILTHHVGGYSTPAAPKLNEEVEPSSSRPTYVTVTYKGTISGEVVAKIVCGGLILSETTCTTGANYSFSFWCPVGVKWKLEAASGTWTITPHYLTF